MSSWNYYTMRMISSEKNLKTISLSIISELDKDHTIIRPNPERSRPFWCTVENIRICKSEEDTYVLYLDFLSVNSFFDFKEYVENELKIKDVYFCLSSVGDYTSHFEKVWYDEDRKFFKETFFSGEKLLDFFIGIENYQEDEDYEKFCKTYPNSHISKEQFHNIYSYKSYTVDDWIINDYHKKYCYTDLYYLRCDEDKVICDFGFFSSTNTFKQHKKNLSQEKPVKKENPLSFEEYCELVDIPTDFD